MQDRLVKEILGQKWHFGYERRMTFQKVRLFAHAYHSMIPKLFGAPIRYELYYVKYGIISVHPSTLEHDAAFRKIRSLFMDERQADFIKHLTGLIVGSYKRQRFYLGKMPSDYSRYREAGLFKIYNEFVKIEDGISLASWLLFGQFEDIIVDSLYENIEKKSGKIEAKLVIDVCSKPVRITPLEQYHIDMCRIRVADSDSKDTIIRRMTRKYHHRGMYDLTYGYAEEDSHRKAASEILIDRAMNDPDEIKRMHAKRSAETRSIIRRYSKDRHLSALIRYFVTFANYKEWKPYFREQSCFKLRILFEEIARRLDLSLEEAATMTSEELEKSLLHGVKPGKLQLSKRIKNCAYLFKDSRLHIITDGVALGLIEKTLKTDDEISLSGVVAYPGKVVGRAAIVIGSGDLLKVKVGDIMVSPTTRPDYLPAMQRAAAIVTNEGGILSHAAIVARELKKTCLIGTKTATRVFKDGDMLEVDTERQIVKKI